MFNFYTRYLSTRRAEPANSVESASMNKIAEAERKTEEALKALRELHADESKRVRKNDLSGVSALQAENSNLKSQLETILVENEKLKREALANGKSPTQSNAMGKSSARSHMPKLQFPVPKGLGLSDISEMDSDRASQDVPSHFFETRSNSERALIPQRSSFVLWTDDAQHDFDPDQIKRSNDFVDMLKDEPMRPRKEGDDSRAGFYVQMSTEYGTEKSAYPSGFLTLAPTGRGRVHLKWRKQPRLAQIVKRPGQGRLMDAFWTAARTLRAEGIRLVVEPTVLKDLTLAEQADFLQNFGYVRDKEVMSFEDVDFIVVLGGDGTIIWTSNMHQHGIPPLVSFALGSLGFLTPFDVHNMEHVLRNVIFRPEEIHCSVRNRVNVNVFKPEAEVQILNNPAKTWRVMQVDGKKYVSCVSRRVLNEVVIDRGPTSTVVELEVFINDKSIATVQGDGLIVATPTGSTAYSVAAGGSLIHPSLSAIAVSPICCNPLSFRPFVVSDNQIIRVAVPPKARNSAYVSFDGIERMEIKHGEFVEIKFSKFPLVWFCATNDNTDWLGSIETSFNIGRKRERRSLTASPDPTFSNST